MEPTFRDQRKIKSVKWSAVFKKLKSPLAVSLLFKCNGSNPSGFINTPCTPPILIFLEPFGGKRLRILCRISARKSDIRLPTLRPLQSPDTQKLYQLRIFYFFRLILGGLLMSPSVEYLSSSVPLGIRMVRIIPPREFFGYLGSLDINQLSHRLEVCSGSLRI